MTQHKQAKNKPYNKGFNAGAEYAFSEYTTLMIFYLQDLWNLCGRDGGNDAVLTHIVGLQNRVGGMKFPPFLGEAPDNR